MSGRKINGSSKYDSRDICKRRRSDRTDMDPFGIISPKTVCEKIVYSRMDFTEFLHCAFYGVPQSTTVAVWHGCDAFDVLYPALGENRTKDFSY